MNYNYFIVTAIKEFRRLKIYANNTWSRNADPWHNCQAASRWNWRDAPMVWNCPPQEFCSHGTPPPADEGRQRKGDTDGQNGERRCRKSKCETSYLLSCFGQSAATSSPEHFDAETETEKSNFLPQNLCSFNQHLLTEVLNVTPEKLAFPKRTSRVLKRLMFLKLKAKHRVSCTSCP